MTHKTIMIPEYHPEKFRTMLKELLKEILSEASTLYEWGKAKLLPYQRSTSKIYFKKSEIMEAMQKLPNPKERRQS